METPVVRYGHAPLMSKTCFRYVVHAWGAQMSAWIATALAVAATATSVPLIVR